MHSYTKLNYLWEGKYFKVLPSLPLDPAVAAEIEFLNATAQIIARFPYQYTPQQVHWKSTSYNSPINHDKDADVKNPSFNHRMGKL